MQVERARLRAQPVELVPAAELSRENLRQLLLHVRPDPTKTLRPLLPRSREQHEPQERLERRRRGVRRPSAAISN